MTGSAVLWRRPLGLAVSVCAVGMLLAGCSGTDDSSAPSTGSSVSSRPTSQLPTPASTPVPPPTPGTTKSTVKSRPTREKKPIRLDRSASAADKIQVRLGAIKAIKAKAKGPGEVTGPALAVTVQIANSGKEPFDLSGVVVSVTDAKGDPGGLMSGKPADPVSGSVNAGQQVSGVYVFTLPAARRNPVTVRVVASPALPTLVFTGRAPR